MKRYLVVGLCLLFVFTFLISIPFNSYAFEDDVEYPAYTPDSLSHFNHNYSH
jgi:hypothetical protein